MLVARSGFNRGFNSASGKISASVFSVGCDTGTLLSGLLMIALLRQKVVNQAYRWVWRMGANSAKSVRCLTISRLELVELGVAMRGNSALRGLAIEVRARAVVKRSMEINPDLCVRITFVFGRVR